MYKTIILPFYIISNYIFPKLFVLVLAEDAIKAALSDYRIKQQEKKKSKED
jgi:hypothetical protein